MNTLKGQKQTSEQRPTQDTSATKNALTILSCMKPLKEKKLTNLSRKSYAQIAASSSPKITTEKAWTEVICNSQRLKAILPSAPKVELEKRRGIFQQEILLSQKSEADLIFALNKSLQKTRIPTYIQFS